MHPNRSTTCLASIVSDWKLPLLVAFSWLLLSQSWQTSIECSSPSSSTSSDAMSQYLKPFPWHCLATHQCGFMPSDRTAHRTGNESQLFLVLQLALYVLLSVCRLFFEPQLSSLFLRTPSTHHKILVPFRSSPVQTDPKLL